MRVLILAALACVAMATELQSCQSDYNCKRKKEYCAKNDNADGTQRVGVCTARPGPGEACGSYLNGLTERCLDGLTCATDGCCGGCDATRAPVSTPTKSYGKFVPLYKGVNGMICGKPGDVTDCAFTGLRAKMCKSWDYDMLTDRTYLAHYTGVQAAYSASISGSAKGNRKASFKLTGGVVKCATNGVCTVECRNEYGTPGTGTTKVKCTKFNGWKMMSKRCKINRKSWKGYNN